MGNLRFSPRHQPWENSFPCLHRISRTRRNFTLVLTTTTKPLWNHNELPSKNLLSDKLAKRRTKTGLLDQTTKRNWLLLGAMSSWSGRHIWLPCGYQISHLTRRNFITSPRWWPLRSIQNNWEIRIEKNHQNLCPYAFHSSLLIYSSKPWFITRHPSSMICGKR